MDKRQALTCVLLSVFFLGGCASAASNAPQVSLLTPQPTLPPVPLSIYLVTNYPQPQSGGYDTIYAFNASDGSQRWRHDSGSGTIGFTQVLAGGVLYFTVEDVLYAVRTSDNKTLWHYKTGEGGSVPLVAQGVVYVTALDAASHHEQVVALGAITGQTFWHADLGNQHFTPAQVADGVVYLQGETSIVALKADSGQQLWSQKVDGNTFFIAQVADGQVYVNDFLSVQQDILLALSASNGSARWRFAPAPGTIPAPFVTLANGVVYTALNSVGSSMMAALNARDGSVRWKQTFPQNPIEDWVLDQGSFYISLGDGNVAALDAGAGSVTWQKPFTRHDFVIVAAGGGMVYGYGVGTGLLAFNASDGSPKWHIPVEQQTDSKVEAVINGVVYFSTHDAGAHDATQDMLYALNASDGSTRWKYAVGGSFEVMVG